MAARAERTGRALGSVLYEGGERAPKADDREQFADAVQQRERAYARAFEAWQRAGAVGEFESPELEQLVNDRKPELVATRWHEARAQNLREVFRRVEECGEAEGARITLVCRNCKEKAHIDVGCGSSWFCSHCRTRNVLRFRKGLERKRLGLVTIAARAGHTRRNQKKGERWGERMLTVTLPHRGDARERIETLQATFNVFWRRLRDRLRPELQGPSGITIADVPRGFPARFEDREDPNTLKLFDLLHYLYVFEWTPGDDGKGHPHLHVWMFSRFLERDMVKRLWQSAYRHVLRTQRDEGGWAGPIEERELIVDIRAAGADVSHELVKYLTKDWEVNESGAKRAAPEVFAQVYATLVGKRRRQSSAGFSMFEVAKFEACPCCGYERERGHWARIDIEHTLELQNVTTQLGTVAPIGHYWDPERGYTPAPLTAAAEIELRAQRDAQRDSEWLESFERRIVAAEIRKRLNEGAESNG